MAGGAGEKQVNVGDALAVELAGLAAGLAVGGGGEEQRPAPGSGD